MIILTSFADALYNTLAIKALIQTDLPEPVVPAISTCGILARSATTVSPEISLPRTSVNGELDDSNSLEEMPSINLTISRFSLGNSIPMYDFPGIFSTTRTLIIDMPLARSLAKPTIVAAFTPGARSTSKRVITGP